MNYMRTKCLFIWTLRDLKPRFQLHLQYFHTMNRRPYEI